MPDKPVWYGQLDEVIAHLRALPYPWIDRATLQQLLGVGRRRAQQILQPCVTHRIGANGVADRHDLIRRLEQLAAGDTVAYERQRRQKLGETLGRLHQAAIENPRLVVEAPNAVINAKISGLPDGVVIAPGEIRVQFTTTQQALERLLALAMAIGNDFDTFQQAVENPNP